LPRPVKVSAPAIRKHLRKRGFHWLPRLQKRAYPAKERKKRMVFSKYIVRMGVNGINDEISAAMDGVIITRPPASEVDRSNYCLHGETSMWRRKGEACKPQLSGEDPYADQIPLARAIPLWGAISAKGYSDILHHKKKKVSTDEWVKSISKGSMTKALQHLRSSKARRPLRILCDNERFLSARLRNVEYKKRGIELLQIPPRSPDLNPIEMLWSWVRTQLRHRDLADLRKGRPPLGKTAYKTRVKTLLKSKGAQKVGAACFKSLRKKCQQVIRNKGAAIRY
jgi:hypothetical protein